MIHRIVVAIALFVAVSCAAAQNIPPFLVGVWANDGAVMKGPLLFEGQAIYLAQDGVGASVGGPPPIGVKIVATFDTKRSVLVFDFFERNKIVGHGEMVYDEKTKTIDTGGPKHVLLKRRFDTFDEATKKALGL